MPRLVVTRREGESIMIDDDTQITIQSAESGQASVVIEAPLHRKVLRTELWRKDRMRNGGRAPERGDRR